MFAATAGFVVGSVAGWGIPTLYLMYDFGARDIPADWFDALPFLAIAGGVIGTILAVATVEAIMIRRKPSSPPPD
jgi:hypothetical protein